MFEMFDERVDGAVAQSFLTDGSSTDGEGDRPLPLILPLYLTPLAPGQEQQRILIISRPAWVRETIHDLHARGFANVNDWSSVVPAANPDEAISILTRRRQRR